jgi:hypothetical protein
MSKINYNASHTISDIIEKVMDSNAFVEYFEELPF